MVAILAVPPLANSSFTAPGRGRKALNAKAPARKPWFARTVRAATADEDALRAKYPDGGPVFSVSIDCTMGTNSTGIIMKEGPEGRPEVGPSPYTLRPYPKPPTLRPTPYTSNPHL